MPKVEESEHEQAALCKLNEGKLTIPKDIRSEMGLSDNSWVLIERFEEEGDRVYTLSRAKIERG